jgi:chromate transport protein ChrA
MGTLSFAASATTTLPGPGSLTIGGTANVSSSGVAGVSLSCSGATGASCVGKLTLTAIVKTKVKHKVKGHTKAVTETKTVTLGSASYNLTSGKSETLSVRLSNAAMTLLDAASNRKLTAKASATPSTGSTVTKTVTLAGLPAKKTKKK